MQDRDKQDAQALAIAHKMRADEGTGPAFDIQIETVRLGFARLSMRIRADMLNGHGMAHGGMIFTLADTAFAYACNSQNIASVALNATISFLSPVKLGERLIAEAREETTAGRTGIYAVTVYGEGERIVAVFQGLSRTIGGQIISDET